MSMNSRSRPSEKENTWELGGEQGREQGRVVKSNLSLACSVSLLTRKYETAYGRMEMFISFYKGEIERD